MQEAPSVRPRKRHALPERDGGEMSGHGGAQLTQRAAAIGAKEVLRKPLQGRDLAESIARVLGATH